MIELTRKEKELLAKDVFADTNFDPLRTSIDLVKEGDVSDEKKLQASVAMIAYKYPKLSQSTIDASVTIDYAEILTEARKRVSDTKSS